MTVVFGACGGVVRPGPGLSQDALRGFPTVRTVERFHDDACFLAVGSGAARSATGLNGLCADGNGRYALALDGWLANRDELARMLGLACRDDAPAPSDRVLVAAALQRWGSEALPRFHGEFAIAWWDRAERRLLLACDRTGGRSLFYHLAGPRLYFANVTAAIFIHPHVPRELDPAVVARAAFALSIDFENSCFAGIKQLLPGQCLEWSSTAGARVSRYWSLDLARRCRFRRSEDYVDAARELLDTVVGQACRTEGVLAATLSGGLDSTAVAATAARLTAPRPLQTITLRPEAQSLLPACRANQFDDEWGHARAVADMYPSMVAHPVPASLDAFDETMRTGFYWMGRPPIHLMAPVWMGTAWRYARQIGASVVLTGLSGNGTLSASALPYAMQAGLRDWPEAFYRTAQAASVGRPVMPMLRAMAPDWLRELRGRLRGDGPVWRRYTALRPEAADRTLATAWREFVCGDRRVSLGRRARLRTIERTWTGRTMGACLRFRDGFDRRDPLGDVRLAEFCLAIPSREFTRLGRDRDFARRVLADRLPVRVLRETRIGRQGAEWFDWATRRRAWLAAELEGIEASALGRELIDIPRLRTILDDWPADADGAEPRYHELMNVLGRGVAVGGFVRWAEGRNM
ncbi:asparagine synthase-related protein [Ancylobacter sp. IITR112]|uniref:asparagine synthase-related protein n=1 Tax=Ancylobacter sp. IITR112 TaxID=3138073 RepID=UPI00352A833A